MSRALAATVAAHEGPALSVTHLTKRFGERLAFDDVSFEVGHGEVFGFLGPNGAGKTTTVRTLGTLIAPTSGSATVAGIPLTPENGVEIRRRIAIMPEAPGLYLRLSVRENLECFADLYEAPDAGERIDRALRAVNLTDRAGDTCGTLSKGLRQRVALARALLGDPEVLFLDEPTSGLDPVAARDVHELIDDLRKRGVTIFLTTHRLEEAERLCDRVAILNTTLRTIGRTDELRDQLFTRSLTVRTIAPLADPGGVLAGIPGVEGWHADAAGVYVIAVSDAALAAPGVTRALVRAGADVLSISESHHSLEDVYLELVNEDPEVGEAMKLSVRRVRAVITKEFREYRRNTAIVVTMAVLPLIFILPPLINVLELSGSSSSALLSGDPLAYMLGIPAIVPSVIAAYAVVGERQQGTLEPLLTTPIRREEFLLAKALSAFVPVVVISYVVFLLFVGCVELFAQPAVRSSAFNGPELLAQLLFTPLIAGWSIWLGIAISTRTNEVRVAQQLGILASLPTVVVTSLVAYSVIPVTPGLVIGFAALLIVLDRAGWTLVSRLFDRERLITGTRA